MESSTDQYSSDEWPSPLTLEWSRTFVVGAIIGGLVALILGLVLELHIYEHFQRQLRDVPFLINGWFLVTIGGGFAFIGTGALVFRPCLRIDSSGIRLARKRVIPWGVICGVRGLISHGHRYLVVHATSRDDVTSDTGVSFNRLSRLHLGGPFDENEFVVPLIGYKCNMDDVVSTVEAFIRKNQET